MNKESCAESCAVCNNTFSINEMWYFPVEAEYVCEKDYGKYTSMIQECDEK